jgi:TRAP-type C4-dicarboxylate transport system permease small subunit
VFGKFERFNHRASTWCEWVGIAAMLVMMAVTFIDVVGAKLLDWRLLGALDFVMLAQIVAIGFGAGMTLILGRHIEVEFFVNLLPKKLQTVIQIVVLLLSLALFIVLIWQLILLGHSFQTSGEYSPTAYIRLFPFAYAFALASIPVCLVLLRELMKLLRKRGVK